MASSSLYLYGTAGCHLCEQAEALLTPLLRAGLIQLQIVDISGNEDLLRRYGLRIPVVGRRDERGEWQELGWPFDQTQVWSWSQASLMCQGS
jgi:hypothetical protein